MVHGQAFRIITRQPSPTPTFIERAPPIYQTWTLSCVKLNRRMNNLLNNALNFSTLSANIGINDRLVGRMIIA